MTKWDRPERFRRGRAITAFGAALAITLAPMQPAFAFQQEQTPVYRDAARPVADRVEDLLSRMTLEEKVGQMQGLWENKGDVQTPEGDFSPERASAAFPHGLGQISRPSDMRGVDPTTNGAAGVTEGAVNRDGRQTVEYINAAQRWALEETRLGIPLIFHEESLHGYTARGATQLSPVHRPGQHLGSRADHPGVQCGLARDARPRRAPDPRPRGGRGARPPLGPHRGDLRRGPAPGVRNRPGRHPRLSGRHPAPGRGPGLRHPQAHDRPRRARERHQRRPAQISERVLREVFFPPFERAVRELPVRSIMASYNEIDGLPSHANRWLLHDVLREEWGYDGLIVSDYFAIREMVTRHQMFADIQDATVRAMDAGIDIELPDGEGFVHLPELVAEGRISEAQIDDAVRRILTMKFEAGLFENPYADPDTADALTATPDAIALARQVAGRAITLLKNDDQTLPLRADGLGRLAVLGTHAVDTPIGGYSDIPRHVVSVLEGLEAEAESGGFEVVYSEGVRLTESREWAADEVNLVDPAVNARLIEEAVAVARQSDVIVMVLGENEQLSREAWAENHLGDRADLQLVGQQMDLARAIFALNKPTIVLLLNGRPLAVGELVEQADALIQGWYLGQETGTPSPTSCSAGSIRAASCRSPSPARWASCRCSTTTSRPRAGAICSTRPAPCSRSATASATPASRCRRRA